jgi:hypothetical protein
MTSDTPDTNLEPEVGLEAPPIAVNGADPAPLSDAEKVKVKKVRARKAKAEKEGRPPLPDEMEPAPSIQPEGSFPSIEEAFADMSEPEPTPPIQYGLLRHSPMPPASAFRAIPREGSGFFLWMVTLPFGEAEKGEAFNHPIKATLLKQLHEECPTLAAKRFEIRLLIDVAGKPQLLEVPADRAGNARGEDNRQSLLKMLAYAETHWILGHRLQGGMWGWTDAATESSPQIPTQSQRTLISATYAGGMFVDMNHVILQRFRRKQVTR